MEDTWKEGTSQEKKKKKNIPDCADATEIQARHLLGQCWPQKRLYLQVLPDSFSQTSIRGKPSRQRLLAFLYLLLLLGFRVNV